MTKPCNFPGRLYARRGSCLERLKAAKQQSLTDWQLAPPRSPSKTAEAYKKRGECLDKEIAHLEAIQAADLNPLGKKTKKVQANRGRR